MEATKNAAELPGGALPCTAEAWNSELESLRRSPVDPDLEARAIPCGVPSRLFRTSTRALLHPVNYTYAELTLDYGSAGLKVARAMHHLDEAIPNRQPARAAAALRCLQEGATELAIWMELNGYPTSPF